MKPASDDIGGTQAGVTLIEMLVVLGLMALIGVFITGGLTAVRRALPLNAAMAGIDELALARDHLRWTISEAVAQSLLREAVYFEGSTEQVNFVAAADPLFEAPGLVRVAIQAENVGGQLSLVERRRLDREDQVTETGAAVLISGIGGLSFIFTRSGVAFEQVKKEDTMPDSVTITVTFPPGDRRRFPPLEIPLICAPLKR
jgi:prepilin-type N-terminal cleavage/methylation domain-containing protein